MSEKAQKIQKGQDFEERRFPSSFIPGQTLAPRICKTLAGTPLYGQNDSNGNTTQAYSL